MTSPCESRVGDATLAGPGGRKLGLRRVRRAKVRVGTAGPIFRGPRKGRADSRREFPPRAIIKLEHAVTLVFARPVRRESHLRLCFRTAKSSKVSGDAKPLENHAPTETVKDNSTLLTGRSSILYIHLMYAAISSFRFTHSESYNLINVIISVRSQVYSMGVPRRLWLFVWGGKRGPHTKHMGAVQRT